MRAIYKKEIKSYFTSAIAWVFLAFFLVLTGLFFFLYNLSGGSLNFSTVYGAIEIFFILSFGASYNQYEDNKKNMIFFHRP